MKQHVNHNVSPVDQCTANATTMSDRYVALPLKMDVAVRFGVENGGWAPPTRQIFVGGLFPKFNLVADLVVNHLNCLTCFGSKSSTSSF
eukprot:8235131-Prorocentrum_lima.AAC.1